MEKGGLLRIDINDNRLMVHKIAVITKPRAQFLMAIMLNAAYLLHAHINWLWEHINLVRVHLLISRQLYWPFPLHAILDRKRVPLICHTHDLPRLELNRWLQLITLRHSDLLALLSLTLSFILCYDGILEIMDGFTVGSVISSYQLDYIISLPGRHIAKYFVETLRVLVICDYLTMSCNMQLHFISSL